MNLKLQSKSRTIYAFLMALFSVWGWGQNLVYSLDLANQSSAFGTANTYGSKSGTVSGVTWYANAASCQSSNIVWLGTNNATNYNSLTKLNAGINNRGAAIASALGIQTTASGYYALVGANAISNVGSIKVKASATGGTAPATLWCLYTTDGGSTYNILGSVSSPGAVEQNFTPTSAIASAQYAFVFYSTSAGTYRAPYFEFYEGAVTQTANPSIVATGTPNGVDTYWNTASINLSSASSGASIYYTTDGTTPTISSTQYTAPFQINATSEIKAIAIAPPLTVSTVTTKQIIITNPATATIPYSQAFNNTLGDWMNYKESGSAGYIGWTTSANGAESNGYQLGTAKAWLISPKFTGVQTNSLLSFNYASQYEGDDLKIMYSTNYAGYGDPAAATWANLTTIAEASGTAVSTGNLTNFAVPTSGNVHIAFVYEDASTGGWAMWRVSNFSLSTPVQTNTVWNGTAWSNGIPSATIDAVISSNYAGSGFTAQNITIDPTYTLTINSGQTITAENVINNGSIIVNDGGNFIQTVGGAYTAGTGASFVANRNSASVADKYVFWSSPVADQNIFKAYTDVVGGTAPQYVMTYNTGTNYYDQVANADANFTSNAGKGYSVKVPQLNAALAFGGISKVPNNGSVDVTLSTSGNGFNLVGNPYPSNINLTDFYTANSTVIEPTLWFWDNTTGNVITQNGNTAVNIGYATFNGPSGTWTEAPNTASGAGYNSAALNAIGAFAKTGQGFIVKATAAGPVTFTNAIRTSNSAVTLNKNVNTNSGKFWIKLTTSYGNTVTQAITYSQGASDAYDVYDSKAMGMGSDAFYSLAGSEKLVIQGRSSFHTDDVVQLGNKHFENGNFTISLSHKEGLFVNGQEIYLHDKQTGTYTNLQAGAYSFSANAGDFTNRFEIVYKLNVLSINETEKGIFEVYRNGEDFVVRNNKNIQSVEIFDAAGRKIQQITSNSKSVTVEVPAKGMYILKAISEGKEYTQKIIK
ncbi:FN3 associated domain-containing protein [Chryseobacterium sp. RLHN22]|uniref:FN3 associated domain-containing protein n=1 Tax=Chryseobacterium sp. RLHN22 TaxID=3437885 RepID=UPI003D9ABAD4